MRTQRIYVDTSVVGGCYDEEFAFWSKGLVRDFRVGLYAPVVSEVVAAEIADAPTRVQSQFQEILSLDRVEYLTLDRITIDLAERYQERRIVSPKLYDDGLHIALATRGEVDVLVSWNFKHIVHFEKIRLFNAVNLEQGFKPLQIYSPREVMRYGDE